MCNGQRATQIARRGGRRASGRVPFLRILLDGSMQAAWMLLSMRPIRDGGSRRGGFQTRPRLASLDPPMRSNDLQFAADHGNSVVARMWHEGGFETRPYNRRDCAIRNLNPSVQARRRPSP